MNHTIRCGNCLDLLPEYGQFDCLFADPPDGIGLGYDAYDDSAAGYELKLLTWVTLFVEHASTVWLSFNSRWTLQMAGVVNLLMGQNPGLSFKPCVQTFSFYQHNKHDFGDAHRPLWRLSWPDAEFYADQVKVTSWRQQHGDKRATAGGKVPGNAFDFTKVVTRQRRDWHTRAIQCGEWVVDPLIPDDHFDFTRVTGNSHQRRSWHPTQLNEGLVERCIKSCTREGGTVLDPFAGTGTTLRVCKRINRSCTTFDVDPVYCANIAAENSLRFSCDAAYESAL